MSGNRLPFHTQAALLEHYAQLEDPQSDAVAVQIVHEVLAAKPDLRTYFFRHRPNPSWVPIVWSWGLLSRAPEPEQTAEGYRLPEWVEQDWLVSVAPEVPAFIIKHVLGIHGHGRYVSEAIKALTQIPADQAAYAASKVVEFLREPTLASWIATEAFDVVKYFANNKQLDSALLIFKELTAPLQAQNTIQVGSYVSAAEAISKFGRDWNERKVLQESLDLFRQHDLCQLIEILETQLVATLRFEAQSRNIPEEQVGTFWRSAIEDSNQDLRDDYKDQLLSTLRDAMEALVIQDADRAQTIIDRYLHESNEILRRLGIHLLHRFPSQFQKVVWRELQRQELLDDVGAHHEVFLLLREGYPHLLPAQQTAIVETIQNGPSSDLLAKMATWAASHYDADPQVYVQAFTKRWTRDRLWMLREYLTGEAQQQLSELLDAVGVQDHPEFTHWSSGGFVVQDVSPLQETDMSHMGPQQLLQFLYSWQPPTNPDWGAARVSYRGLAKHVAAVIVTELGSYRDVINEIARLRPEFAYELLRQFTEQADTLPENWDIQLGMCESLLADTETRLCMERAFEINWPEARHGIVNLLQKEFERDERSVPDRYLSRVRNLLLVLLDDPDPDDKSDQPGEGWFGHGDPATVAINHVRSDALITLIQYAHTIALIHKESYDREGPGPKRLEATVEAALSRKLNRAEDPSCAVHSVYGRFLDLLYWLDQEWTEAHLDTIFPEGTDPFSESLFVAAWDSYVIFDQHVYKPLFDLLRPKYLRAIDNLERGLISKTHLDPMRSFGSHVLMEYLNNTYDPRSPEGHTSLIVKFFSQVPARARQSVVWLVWANYHEDLVGFATIWGRIRQLWEWRAQQASLGDHSAEFDGEMEQFATLLPLVPVRETIVSLWPLLENLIPHITRAEHRNLGWNAVEEYLAQQVRHDPVRVIKLYGLMQQQLAHPRWFFSSDEARTIIQAAAADIRSRQDTLALIDNLSRAGMYAYRDVYERYT